MKFTEFEKETRITNFAKRCLLDVNYNEKGESYRVPVHEWARKCWRKAKTFEEFVELFFATDEEEIVRSQGYCELSKTLNAKAHEKLIFIIMIVVMIFVQRWKVVIQFIQKTEMLSL